MFNVLKFYSRIREFSFYSDSFLFSRIREFQNYRKYVPYALKGQKLIARGNALGYCGR